MLHVHLRGGAWGGTVCWGRGLGQAPGQGAVWFYACRLCRTARLVNCRVGGASAQRMPGSGYDGGRARRARGAEGFLSW